MKDSAFHVGIQATTRGGALDSKRVPLFILQYTLSGKFREQRRRRQLSRIDAVITIARRDADSRPVVKSTRQIIDIRASIRDDDSSIDN